MTIQRRIIKELQTKSCIDCKDEFEKRVQFLVDYCLKHPYILSMVLGISGGQDSTLTGKIGQTSVERLRKLTGKPYQFIAMRLPYGVQKDEADAQDALTFINPDKSVTINIKAAVDAAVQSIEEGTKQSISDFDKGNIKARQRMIAQYGVAAMYKGVVIGTDHAAEAIMGFYTKWGDGAVDITPIFGLTKGQGRDILKMLGCPKHLYEKAPTADLEENRPQLPDEIALGVSYQAIDSYLTGFEIPKAEQKIIEEQHKKTEHKRKPPISIYDTWWK